MTYRTLLRALLGLFLLSVRLRATGPFDGYHEASISTGRLFWKSWPVEALQSVREMIPGTLSDVEARLERKLDRPFSTALVPDIFELRRVVERLTGSAPSDRATLGVAIPSLMVLVIRGDFASSLDPISVTVAHEIAHLVIHRKPSATIPRWIDEGVAMWSSQASIPADDEAYLAFLARVGGLYRFESLEHRFPDAHELSSIAYQQSFSAIQYLVDLRGKSAVPALLDGLEAGGSSEIVLERLSGLNRIDLEERFAIWTASRRSLASALASIFNLWTACALLALVAIARSWLRRRKRLAAMAAQEADEPAFPEAQELEEP